MYILIGYGILSIIAVASVFASPKASRWKTILVALFFAFVVLSFPLGRDTSSYAFAFNRVSSFLDAFKYDLQRNFGFNALLYITKYIYPKYWFFRLVYNCIVLGLCGLVVKKYSKNPLFSIVLMLGSGIICVYYASAIRQMMAMAIFLVAYFQFLGNKKYAPYCLLILLAASFHEVAIITLLFPFISMNLERIKKNLKKWFLIGLGIGIALCIVMNTLMPILGKTIGYSSLLTHLLIYFTNTNFSVIGLLLRIVLFSFNLILFMKVKESMRTNDDYLFISSSFLSFVLYIVFCNFSLVARVSDFISIIDVIMIPNLIEKIEGKQLQATFLTTILIVNAVCLYSDILDKTDWQIGSERYTLTNYPYICIFETQKIDSVIELAQ